MFTPKKIENALVKLFDLFDAEVMEGLYENYGEEIDDISPKWLAKAFTEMPVRFLSSVWCVVPVMASTTTAECFSSTGA